MSSDAASPGPRRVDSGKGWLPQSALRKATTSRVWRGPRIHDNDAEFSEFTVWGPTCDSYDVLPQIFTLPADIDEDVWVEFGLMGAYTQASLTPFNGFDRRDQYWVEEVYTGKDMQPE